MGNALRHVRGESQKNIVRFIEGLSGKYSRWDIWQDFIIMSAIAIANTMGGPQAKAREEMYRTFNMGIGMIMIVDEKDADAVLKNLADRDEKAYVIGKVVDSDVPVTLRGGVFHD